MRKKKKFEFGIPPLEKFDITPPGAPHSPALHEEIMLDATFAVILAHAIGYFDPLLARLRAISKLEPYEVEFLTAVAEDWVRRRKGGQRQVDKNRRYLEIAAYYLEHLGPDQDDPPRGRKTDAQEFARKKCGLRDERQVRLAITFARTVHYGHWWWWEIASKLARKGKIKELHGTY
jgi:hypothetical protein